MKLIVGLGNPGKRYAATRHNLGFLIVDRIAAQIGIALGKKLHEALVGSGSIEGEKIVLAKPQTYMNRSGPTVADLLREFGIPTDDLVVINDDLDLPFGRIRIRPGGSAGGHRGLGSIAESLAGAPFCRVRVGIGRPPEGVEAAEYVLEPFSAAESGQLGEIVDRGAESVTCLVRDGLDRAMANYNRAS
ncbi:MAG: aminoacyl-tRNA hydrolase [Candidatus Binatia bacterium]